MVARFVALALLVTHASVGVRAQNLIQNPYFHSDLSDWSIGPLPVVRVTHQGVGGPGFFILASAKITASSSGGSLGASGLSQCVAATAGVYYDFGGWFKENLLPLIGGSTQTGGARLRVAWFQGFSCDTPPMSADSVDPIPGAPGWQELFVDRAQAPAFTQSARVELIQSVDDFGDHSAFWDNILFQPSAEIFTDGFESGNSLGWTSAQGRAAWEWHR